MPKNNDDTEPIDALMIEAAWARPRAIASFGGARARLGAETSRGGGQQGQNPGRLWIKVGSLVLEILTPQTTARRRGRARAWSGTLESLEAGQRVFGKR